MHEKINNTALETYFACVTSRIPYKYNNVLVSYVVLQQLFIRRCVICRKFT